MIRLYDTMAREKRVFVPADPSRITMYVCGPTVYGRAHIGNARPAVVFDTLALLIRHQYGPDSLVYARNVTDVDDKIIAAAEAEEVGYRVITERYYKHYLEDMGALGVEEPSSAPRATAHIEQMVALIERLMSLGYAYEANGHVLFEVSKDPHYGMLSRRDRDAILAGARVEVAPYKRDPADFVLWKPAGTSAEQVALSFQSPWGRGRPGWHIECSAMIRAHLGQTIDIHGGGLDLIFPHHENEIAQSRCAHGKPLANYWVHNGFVDMGAEKMSKSLGNVVLVNELLGAGHRGEVLRLALLSAHYRSPLPWTESLIAQSKSLLDRLYRRIGDCAPTIPDLEFVAAVSDDLNTPGALARLSEIREPGVIKASGNLLGLFDWTQHEHEKGGLVLNAEPGHYQLTGGEAALTITSPDSVIDRMVAERDEARANRDFATADEIRKALKQRRVTVEDNPNGKSTWRRA